MNLYTLDSENQDLLRRATELSSVPHGRKDYFRKRLWDADADHWSISGLKTGAAADALRAAISLSSAKLLLFCNQSRTRCKKQCHRYQRHRY